MADFAAAMAYVFPHEGGFANDAADKGGPTWKGLTLRLARHYFPQYDEHTLHTIPDSDIAMIFRSEFWRFNSMTSQRIASKVFDMAVNMGLFQAVRLLQGALNDCGNTVVVDGRFGPKTLWATNDTPELELLAALCKSSLFFYTDLMLADPTQRKFKGWIARANHVPPVEP